MYNKGEGVSFSTISEVVCPKVNTSQHFGLAHVAINKFMQEKTEQQVSAVTIPELANKRIKWQLVVVSYLEHSLKP